MKEKNACSTIRLHDLHVPAGVTLDLSNLNDGTKVLISGRMRFGFKNWHGPLMSVSGRNILVQGQASSVIDGQGYRWWDGKGNNGGKSKPSLFLANHLVDSRIESLSVLNTPVNAFTITRADNLYIHNVRIDNSLGDKKGAHNSDGFNIGLSTGVYIDGARVYNQDDCFAANSGTNITFINGFCEGGHGISVGSIGHRLSNVVKGVRVLNSKVVNSDNGVRIKTIAGASGSVSDVVFKDITLSGISKNGIVVQQDYKNSSPTGVPTSGVPITELTVENVSGTIKPGGTNVYIMCASCSQWTWENNNVTGGEKIKENKGVPPEIEL